MRAVINMSFGGGSSQPLDAAVAALVGAGAVVVVAAGNSADDACGGSPAGAATAFAVAAMDETDHWATFSNVGPCVDIVAPGVEVTSAWVGTPTASKVLSGTSMSSPLAAGTAALVLEAFPAAAVSDVLATLSCEATVGALLGVPAGTINSLLYSPPTGFATLCAAGSPPLPGTTAGAGSFRAPALLAAFAAVIVTMFLASAGMRAG